MYASRLRAAHSLSRQCALATRSFASTARQLDLGTAVPTTAKEATPPQAAGEEPLATPVKQAPNRDGVWSRSQKPRSEAMTGPRFEQTDYTTQVGVLLDTGTERRTGMDVQQLTRCRFHEYSHNRTLPWSSSTRSRCAGRTTVLLPAMVAAVLLAIPGSSSTPTSQRFAPAATAGCLL